MSSVPSALSRRTVARLSGAARLNIVGLVVPLVLGVGAIVAAAMTGGFIDQHANPGNLGVFVGSLLHVAGLIAAVGGGVRMALDRRASERER